MSNFGIIALTSSLGSFIWFTIVLVAGITWWYGPVGMVLIVAVAWLGVKE